jgi:peptidoglycan/xylan/chitin deacetylase (PgdA/CDA1 family)
MLKLTKKLLKGLACQTAAHIGEHTLPSPSPKLWVLMYHRIMPKSDPRYYLEEPGMIATPDSFRLHLDILSQHYRITSLSDWLKKANTGSPLPPKSIAITFDDGWLDNYQYAFDLLKEYNTAFTTFIVSDMVGTNDTFWPNHIGFLSSSEYIDRIADSSAGKWLSEIIASVPGNNNHREKLAQTIQILKQYDDKAIIDHIDAIRHETQIPYPQTPSLMNWHQIMDMTQSGLAEIGCHTSSHRRLTSKLDSCVLQREIISSKEHIEQKLGSPIELFCYPNGDVSPQAEQLVKENFLGAVTTNKGINSAKTPKHLIKRIGVHDDISNTKTKFLSLLSGWL